MPIQSLPVLNPSEIVKTPLHRLTVSSINDLDCPRKYFDSRIQRNWDDSRGPIFAVANGQAIHKVNKAIYEARRGYELDLTRLEALAKGAVYGTAYPPETNRQAAVDKVIQSSRAFAEADDEEAIEGTLDLERQGQFEVKNRRTGEGLFLASGKLGRTLVRASEPHRGVIRESKTTKQKISLQEAFLMLWIFRKMYTSLHLSSWAIEYDFLDADLRVVREIVDWEDVQGQSAILLRKALRVFRSTQYPAIQGEACTYCRFRDECCTLQDEPVDLDALENPELVP